MWISKVRLVQLELSEQEARGLTSKIRLMEQAQHGQEIAWTRKEADLIAKANQAIALGAEKTREIGTLRQQVAELNEERKLHMDWITRGMTGVPIYHPDPAPKPVAEAQPEEKVLTTLEEAIQAVGMHPGKIAKWVEAKKQMDFDLKRAGLERETDPAKARVAQTFEQDAIDAKVEAQISK